MASPMAPKATIPRVAADISGDEIARLQSLLERKLQDIPKNHLPHLNVHDILDQAPKKLRISTLPPDLQLSFFLRVRNAINRSDACPWKDENKQPLKITRAIFFYHLSEAHQFQRFHDTARWNMAFFTALLSTATTPPTQAAPGKSSPRNQPVVPKPETIVPAARRFMTSYLAAVMERHNMPSVFDKREEFVRKWKDSAFDVFTSFKSSQAKLLRKAMQRLNKEWETELDRAMRDMGKTAYNARVAPFVGSIIPGRKDQGLLPGAREGLREFTRCASLSPEAGVEMDASVHGNIDLLDALRAPLEEHEYQKMNGVSEEGTRTPVDIRLAITSMQIARPADMLPALMRLFPV